MNELDSSRSLHLNFGCVLFKPTFLLRITMFAAGVRKGLRVPSRFSLPIHQSTTKMRIFGDWSMVNDPSNNQ